MGRGSRSRRRAAQVARKQTKTVKHGTLEPSRGRRVVVAKYDAVQTTVENRRHWANADGLSAKEANSPEVRKKARDRARYEVANNTYAKGIIRTLANDVIGTGPRLRLFTADRRASEAVEWEFALWSIAVDLPGKLRLMREARGQDGEPFGILTTNPRIDHAVKLDLVVLEPEQVATPDRNPLDSRSVDGIEFDQYGNPVRYHVLDEHPGDMTGFGSAWGKYQKIDAKHVIHWFRKDRAGQARGLPEILPALPLFALLRRFTLATVTAAEFAANAAGVLQTDASPDEADDVEPMDSFEIERGMLVTNPRGWKLAQLKAEHPSTTYPEFKRALLSEIARVLNIPYNVAAGDSSNFNYASGRLDHQTYFKSVRVDRADCETRVLDRIFAAWYAEASLRGLIPATAGPLADWDRGWFWDGQPHVDPVKEAQAQAIRLENNTTTLADEWAANGADYETKLVQRAREKAMLRRLGLTEAEALPARQPAPAPANARDEDEEDDDA